MKNGQLRANFSLYFMYPLSLSTPPVFPITLPPFPPVCLYTFCLDFLTTFFNSYLSPLAHYTFSFYSPTLLLPFIFSLYFLSSILIHAESNVTMHGISIPFHGHLLPNEGTESQLNSVQNFVSFTPLFKSGLITFMQTKGP